MPLPESQHDRINQQILRWLTAHPPCATLKRLREEAGLTPKEFVDVVAEKTGYFIPSAHYGKFERGGERPWKRARSALAQYYGLPESEVLPEIGTVRRGRRFVDNPKKKKRSRAG